MERVLQHGFSSLRTFSKTAANEDAGERERKMSQERARWAAALEARLVAPVGGVGHPLRR
jgi:hypothetical protein